MQPQVRTLDQIVSEIRGVYDPQINSVRQKQSMLPQMVAGEEKALGAKQEQAFGDILSGARRRGLGFSGIPLGEQAKYSATEYLPALARLRQSGQEQAISLEEAILGINERMQGQALGMRQYEQQRYDQWQAQQQALAEQRRASAAQGSMLGSLFGGGAVGGEAPQGPVDPPEIAKLKKNALAQVNAMIGRKGTGGFLRELLAISKSAGYGNQADAAKLELLRALQPGYFDKSTGGLNMRRINQLNTIYR